MGFLIYVVSLGKYKLKILLIEQILVVHVAVVEKKILVVVVVVICH